MDGGLRCADDLWNVEKGVREALRSWGYREVDASVLMDYDTLRRGSSAAGSTCKLIDGQGEVLALRPDMTAPIAHGAATQWRVKRRPLRLAYCGRAFRRIPSSGIREVRQAGVELIGVAQPDGDAEVIALACEAVRAAGLDRFQVNLGHNGLLHELSVQLGLTTAQAAELRRALVQRDFVSTQRILESCSDHRAAETMVELLIPYGGRGDLSALSSLGLYLEGLEKLDAVVEALEAYEIGEHLRLDVSLARDFDYYTGVVFEIYCPIGGVVLGGGGRYDELIGTFGEPEAATGFALDLGALGEAVRARDHTSTGGIGCLVMAARSSRSEAVVLANQLRRRGFRVTVHLETEDPQEDAARRLAREMGLEQVLLVGDGNHLRYGVSQD